MKTGVCVETHPLSFNTQVVLPPRKYSLGGWDSRPSPQSRKTPRNSNRNQIAKDQICPASLRSAGPVSINCILYAWHGQDPSRHFFHNSCLSLTRILRIDTHPAAYNHEARGFPDQISCVSPPSASRSSVSACCSARVENRFLRGRPHHAPRS